ncbi:MAG: hypothetical protein JRH16_19785 [Deltaproteobacteria bacterium]|nr:hypothetical protein [Deltaproteobacteria bacterium]MBW2361833.1 hypothetical protein [Deltaproteobacteria bacterium]
MSTSDVASRLGPIVHARVELGSVLVSLLEALPGHEVELHRWYERDHFYAGCMVGPYFFSGRRYVATRALKDLRFPDTTPVVDDIARGSYLALYWLQAGHHEAAVEWAVSQVNWLGANDRMVGHRAHVHAGFYQLRWRVERDADGVPAELALEHPFAGVVLLMVDRDAGVDRETFESAYRAWIEPRLAGTPAALCLGLEPEPLPDDAPSYVMRPPGLERRSLQMFFLQGDPRESWNELFSEQDAWLREAGLGYVSYAAPFIPTIPGTDRYADELW